MQANISDEENENIETAPMKDFVDKNKKMESVTEGKTTVRLSNNENTFSAFYNPAQELNRDLSVLSISTYFSFHKYRKEKEIKRLSEYKFSICEPLSATGLRAIRYYCELDKSVFKEIVANDMDNKAVDCIKQNMARNNVNEEQFKVFQDDAAQLLYTHPRYFDVIDLDPYGSAVPFIDSAVHAAKSGALLCLTFTDMPVLCGNYPETTLYKYGAIPYKASFCHEMAKRIALYAVSSAASKYKKVIKPLLSYNAEFYIRLFLIIKDSPENCKENPFKYGYMYHCRSCQNRKIRAMASKEENKIKKGKANSFVKFNNLTHESIRCEICDSYICMTGPYWIDSLHDEDFINSLLAKLDTEEYTYLKYYSRIKIFLNGIKDELILKSQVFNYDYSRFSSDITLSTPKLGLFKGALESLGYKIAQSYYDPNLFKTDAEPKIIYDILKKYKLENYKDEYLRNVKDNTYKYKILTKEITVNPVFTDVQPANAPRVTKYPENPFPNWGPQSRAKEEKTVLKKSEEKSEETP